MEAKSEVKCDILLGVATGDSRKWQNKNSLLRVQRLYGIGRLDQTHREPQPATWSPS